MSAGLAPICFSCTRLRGLCATGWCCDAFPGQISVDILSSQHDHREAFRGDGGLRYDPLRAPEEVDYEPVAKDAEHRCDLCENFREPTGCRMVAGQVSPTGWCKLWKASDAVRADAAGWDQDKIRRRKAWMEFGSLVHSRDYPDFQSILGADWAAHLPLNKTRSQYLREAQRLMHQRYGEDPPYEEVPPEYRHDQIVAPQVSAAGVMLVHDGKVLLLRRVDTGEWAFPGGHIEDGETAEDAARRECEEEIGYRPDVLKMWTRRVRDGVDFTTFITQADEEVEPVLNHEHDASTWAPLDDLQSQSIQELGL